MTALTEAKSLVKLNGSPLPCSIPLTQKAGTTIYPGALCSVDTTGYCRPARVSTTDTVVGYAKKNPCSATGNYVSTVAGDTVVEVASGVIKMVNSAASDLIAITELYDFVYVVDDQTVAKTDGTGTRIRAGRCVGVDTGGVYVLVGLMMTAAAAVTLTGAETLTNKTLEEPVITGAGLESLGDASFVANDCALALAGADSGGFYEIDTTGAASTVTFTAGTGLVAGDHFFFVADGTKNGHTVTYYDGVAAISAAATASKRHTNHVIYDGTNFHSQLVVGP